MLNISIPKNAQYILNKLNACGFEAYAVGGCVRDSILGITPNDWDICTSALPEEVLQVFSEDTVVPTGLKHGTVTIVLNHEPYEVTTYRIDGEYTDNRRPDSVQFTSDITQDLKRRDFTVNAMAYNPANGLVDPFGGREDLKNKTIRCVGNPDERFDEDALRVLRAWRFSCQLGFEIDSATLNSAKRHLPNLVNVSVERIQAEFMKAFAYTERFCADALRDSTFLTAIIPEWAKMDIDQHNEHHIYTVGIHTLKALEAVSNCDDIVVKLAVLFHDIGKPYCFTLDENGTGHFYGHSKIGKDMTNEIMRRLRFDNTTRENVLELIYYHDSNIEAGAKYIKRWLNKIGEEQFRRLLLVKSADVQGQNPVYTARRLEWLDSINAVLDAVLSEEQCFSMKDMAINGKDLIEIGFEPGVHMGNVLKTLLEKVIADEIKNDKNALIAEAKRMKDK